MNSGIDSGAPTSAIDTIYNRTLEKISGNIGEIVMFCCVDHEDVTKKVERRGEVLKIAMGTIVDDTLIDTSWGKAVRVRNKTLGHGLLDIVGFNAENRQKDLKKEYLEPFYRDQKAAGDKLIVIKDFEHEAYEGRDTALYVGEREIDRYFGSGRFAHRYHSDALEASPQAIARGFVSIVRNYGHSPDNDAALPNVFAEAAEDWVGSVRVKAMVDLASVADSLPHAIKQKEYWETKIRKLQDRRKRALDSERDIKELQRIIDAIT